MSHFINVTEQASNLILDHRLYQARIAMRQVMREGYEVMAIEVNTERPVLHIATPMLPVPFSVESVQFNPKTAVHSFRAYIYQCGAHIADLVWTSPQTEVNASWAS